MFLTISTTMPQATDLGYLLHKNPARTHTVSLNFGTAHVFYPEATSERCTAAFLVEIDPVALVRGSGRDESSTFALYPYVNDRPYVASSFTSVALAHTFNSAMKGRCKDKPALVAQTIPLEATLSVVPCRGGESFLRKLFEPLGYRVDVDALPLDAVFPQWGNSPFFRVRLIGTQRVQDLFTHLYVLLPVLDSAKHYWVGDDEVEKLLRAGESWLKDHPEREQIALRYLKSRRSLARLAIERLEAEEGHSTEEGDATEEGAMDHPVAEARPAGRLEAVLEAPLRLNDRRLDTLAELVESLDVDTVADLGCGEGKLLKRLLAIQSLKRVVGIDVSIRSLEIAEARLQLHRMTERQRERIELLHGSLIYRDRRLEGFDVVLLVEVIEHLELDRVAALERVVFAHAKPRHVVLTTPNAEYNAKFPDLNSGKFRHSDHRFEWTRAEFRAWGDRVAAEYGYKVEYRSIGDEDDVLGAPTQMAIFAHGN